MIELYDYERSGNCHKIRLMLSFLGLEYRRIFVNLDNGEHRSPDFLQLNPIGEIPVFKDGDFILRDSQATLVYLARRYGDETWLPLEPEPLGRVMEWLSTAANDIRQGPEFARRYYQFNIAIDVELATKRAEKIMSVMDNYLSDKSWLVGENVTVADIACFPYIALAQEGKISLDPYPNIRAWIDRLKQLPGYVGMPGL